MKTIKIVTELGIFDVKPKRIFEHNNIKYAIVPFPYKYLNSEDISYMDKCIHYQSGYHIPIYNNFSKTIKGLIEKSIEILDMLYKDLGKDKFIEQINSKEVINN
jgi:hypothetical protein